MSRISLENCYLQLKWIPVLSQIVQKKTAKDDPILQERYLVHFSVVHHSQEYIYIYISDCFDRTSRASLYALPAGMDWHASRKRSLSKNSAYHNATG